MPPHDPLLPLIPVLPHEPQQHHRIEKENNIHDPKRKARLQHRTRPIDIERKLRIGLPPKIPERSQTQVKRPRREIRAAGIGDAAQLDDARDEGADEAEVDEGDEECGFAGRPAPEEGRYAPGRSEHGGDEEDEDVIWRY